MFALGKGRTHVMWGSGQHRLRTRGIGRLAKGGCQGEDEAGWDIHGDRRSVRPANAETSGQKWRAGGTGVQAGLCILLDAVGEGQREVISGKGESPDGKTKSCR